MLLLIGVHRTVSLLLGVGCRKVFLSQGYVVIVFICFADLQIHHGHSADRQGHVVISFVAIVIDSI